MSQFRSKHSVLSVEKLTVMILTPRKTRNGSNARNAQYGFTAAAQKKMVFLIMTIFTVKVAFERLPFEPSHLSSKPDQSKPFLMMTILGFKLLLTR